MTQRDVLFELYLILIRRRWLILSVFFTLFILVCGYVYLQYPLYKATVGFLVQENPRQQPIIFNDISTPAMPDQKSNPSKNIVEITRSFEHARQIADQYQLDARLERRDKNPQNPREKFWYGLGNILNSPIYLLEALGLLEASEPNYRYKAAEKFREDSLDIYPIKDTELVMLSVWEESPSLAVSIADTMSQVLMDKAVSQAQTKAGTAFLFAEEQAALTDRELQTVEENMAQFRQQHHLVDVDQQRELLLIRINTLQASYDGKLEERQRLLSRKAELQHQLKGFSFDILSSTIVAENPLVSELKAEQYRSELDVAAHQSEWSATNPGMVALRARIDETRKALSNENSTVVQSKTHILNPIRQDIMTQIVKVDTDLQANSQNQELLSQIASLQKELGELLDNETQLNRFKRQRKTLEELYMTLKEKVAALEAQRVNRLSEFDIQVFDSPYLPDNAKKAFPEWDITIAIALIAGLTLALMLALLVHYIDDTYASFHSLERDFEGLMLGAVPIQYRDKDTECTPETAT